MKHTASWIDLALVLVLIGLVGLASLGGLGARPMPAMAYQFITYTPYMSPTATSDVPPSPTATPYVPPTFTSTPDIPPTATSTPDMSPTATSTPDALHSPTPTSYTPPQPTGGPPPAGGPPALATPYNLVGRYVRVVKPEGLSLGAAPGFSAAHVRIAVRDSLVCVLAGPVRADSLWWWKFRTADGVEGWGVGDNVEKTSGMCIGTPTPTLTPLASPTTRRPAAAAPGRTPTPQPAMLSAILGVHIVRQGETLFCLGRAYGVSPWAIATRNRLYSPNVLSAGQHLVIPDEAWDNIPPGLTCARQFDLPGAPAAAQPELTPSPAAEPAPGLGCQATYMVRYGDTLWSIARYYGGSPWAIATANNLKNPDLIFVGDQLCIP